MSGPGDFPPCAGWDSGPVDADVAGPVEEFARWLNYLLHPEKHDGPRHYVCADCHYGFDSIRKMEGRELNAYPHGPGDFTHTWDQWELHSVIEGFDPASAFHALHETSGVWWRGSMEECFSRLKDAYFLHDNKDNPAKSPLYHPDASYDDFTKDLDTLLSGIGAEDPRREAATAYHESVKKFAESHENQMFALAEALGRYRGVYLGSRDKILNRMKQLVKIFEDKVAPHPAPPTDWGKVLEVAVPLALTAIFSAVPVAGYGANFAYGVITGAISEVIVGATTEDETKRQFTPKNPDGAPTWENTWREIVDWFVTGVDKISDELRIGVEPNTTAYGTLVQMLSDQVLTIQQHTETNGGADAVPALPAYVPH